MVVLPSVKVLVVVKAMDEVVVRVKVALLKVAVSVVK